MSQNGDSASQQQQPSFLQELTPPTAQHHHDAFGDGDSGVDYGGTILDFEEGDYDSVDGAQGAPPSLNGNAIPKALSSPARGCRGTHQQNIDIPINAHPETIDLTTALDELQEEVGLHETTLSTLHSKLLSLSSEIEAEEAHAESLRGDIQTLSKRKLRLKKKTEGDIELVRRVERTLEKTLSRLKSALGQPEYLDKIDDVYFREGKNDSSPSMQEEASVASIENEIDQDSKYGQAHKAESTAIEMNINKSCSSYIEIPLHHDPMHKIKWPKPDEVIRSKIKQLIPTWRTNLPSPSLWRIHSTDLLARLMSISSMEILLERQYLVDKGILPADSGWVSESCIIGTPLDIYKHVDCTGWLNAFNSTHTLNEPVPLISQENGLDPNCVLCPYELGGVCLDDRCLYQHLGRPQPSSVITLEDGRRYLRYYALPEVQLPPPLSRDDFVAPEKAADGSPKDDKLQCDLQNEDGTEVAKIYPCPTCATVGLNVDDLRVHMQQCNPSLLVLDGTEYSVQNVLFEESRTSEAVAEDKEAPGHRAHQQSDHLHNPEKDIAGDANVTSDFIDNHDMVCLPTIDYDSDSDSSDESLNEEMENKSRGFLFDDQYWWQALIPRSDSVCYDSCHEVIDFILLSFGFEPVRDSVKADACELKMLRCNTLEAKENKSLEIQEIILNARIIDFCQICVHMGQCSFGLSLLRSAPLSKENSYHSLLLQHAFDSVERVSTSRGACDLFTSQVRLTLISQFYQLRYAWLSTDTPKRNKELRVEKLLAFLDEKVNPSDHDMRRLLSSRIPPACDDTGQSGWEDFVSCLQLQLEKHITVPSSYKMTKAEQLCLLLECANIGRVLQHVMGNIHDHTFSPLVHMLDPVWAVIQRLLRPQPLAGNCDSELNPQLLVILVIGPLIFECSSNIISRPFAQTGSSVKSTRSFTDFDTRSRLDLSTLDKSIIGIIKDTRRLWRNRDYKTGNTESLLSPLYMISVVICVSLGAFDRAQLRLSNAIDAKSKFRSHILPFSETLLSQLVHLRMNCPSYTNVVDPRGECDTSSLVAQVALNGIILCRLDACGDMPMISAAHGNLADQEQWENFSYLASAKQQTEYLEFEVSHPKIESARISAFPRSLLVAGQTMKCLSLVGCMLDDLPHSLGLHLSSLVSLNLSDNRLQELPSSIGSLTFLQTFDVSHNKIRSLPQSIRSCVNLQVLDLSYNQLTTFVGDLVLHLPQLQSFEVEGNPAHDSAIGNPKENNTKRQKVDSSQ